MKAKEVLETLGISRRTLIRYVKKGLIKVKQLPTGRYIYDDESVLSLEKPEKNVLFKLTQKDYNEMMEILIECSCSWPNKPSLLEVAQDLLSQTTDFYEEVILRLLIRLHNYGEIDLSHHFEFVDDEERADA